MTNNIIEYLDKIIPNPHCELIYQKDYELLMAVVLSAQCTDNRVNKVTTKLFHDYDLNGINEIDIKTLERYLYELGNYHKKAEYLKEIAYKLINECHGIVPNDASYLESLKGVGHKTASVVLSELYNIPTIAVDTHVSRVSKRLYLAKEDDDIKTIESKIKKTYKKEEWNKINHQLLLFGRYYCKAIKPNCQNCPLKCRYQQKLEKN